MRKATIPAPGGAVQDDAPRPQITEMLAPEKSEKDFDASFPESTDMPPIEGGGPQPAKRKRRSKAEMEAERAAQGGGTAPGITDERLEKCKRKFAAMGGGDMIKAGFSAVAPEKALSRSESEDVDDYFYMLSAKGGIDPMKNWFMMFLTLFCLLLRLVLTRTDVFDKLKDIIFPPEKKDGTKDDKPEEVAA